MENQTDLTKEVPFLEGVDKLKEYDFVRLISPDMNGIHLGKLVPTRHARRIMLNRCEIYGGILTMGPRFEIHMVPEILEKKHENGYLVPDMVTCHPCPWASMQDSSLVCGIICEMNWQDGSVIQGHPRTVARRLLSELAEKHNLELFSGFEPEFRVFRSEGFQEACTFPSANRHQENESSLFKPPKPYSNLFDMYRCAALNVYEPFLFDLDHKLKAANVDMQDFMHEYGSSQLETPLMPQHGIQAADSYFIFKQAIRETAKLHNMVVSFMTKPLLNELANGCHYNHSLWDRTTGRNVLFDAQDDDNLSSVAKHWIGGLIAHMPALTALCSPTVNCYRRFNGKFSPTSIDWDINDRFVALRVKNVDENRTYIENRICSSASCPYHVMAATVAAGMDGIERKLEPPERGKKTVTDEERETDLPKLPTTLREALTTLQADTVLTNRLGTQFVDWFIRTKQHGDLLTLSDVDVKEDSEKMLAYERYEYLEFI
ncbi:Glutamine synthetase [Paragonimus heterotremus]|uniref:Lengsin n=1 Tax=Paragonimus heterotremus TaxID=100268 RepID=A0A8J4SN22_9TREM|nr:Glutamine synthetase [Paragonimus heterotremus]